MSSRWKLYENWEQDIKSMSEDRLRASIELARAREDQSEKKSRRAWRERRRQAEQELEKRLR